jgi:N-acyl-L-homoserine lactone synthetase
METLTFRPQQSATASVSKKFPFEIRVLARDAGRSEVFALRYRAYREAWCIPLDTDEQYRDRFDDLASTVILGAYDAGVCVGALRVNFSHAWQGCDTLPCAERYPDVAAVKAGTEGTIVEMSRLSIDPAITNTSYRTTLYASLLRAGFMAAQAGNVAKILLVTKPDWIRFYQYMLGFKTIGEPQIYPPSKEPVALLGGSFGDAQKHQRAQNAFFKITPDEIASMKRAIAPALIMPAPIGASAKGRY